MPGLARQELSDSCNELRSRITARQPRPLQFPKLLRYPLIIVSRVVDYDRHQECFVRGHEMAAIDRELPFEPEIPFGPIMGVLGDDGKKQGAALDLLADRLIPGVSAPQLALVEPDFDSSAPKHIADPTRSIGVLRSVAKKYSPRRRGHLVRRLSPQCPSSYVVYRARMPRHAGFRQRGRETVRFSPITAAAVGRTIRQLWAEAV